MIAALSAFGKVVEAAGDISRSNPPDKRDGMRGELGSYNGDKLDRALAALPRPDDPEAVEALAKWLWGQYDRAVCITSEVADTVGTPWEMAGERHQNMKRLEARAILSALAAGGGK
mgnify:CR=1 FL=1